jgi:hypothetical protein
MDFFHCHYSLNIAVYNSYFYNSYTVLSIISTLELI